MNRLKAFNHTTGSVVKILSTTCSAKKVAAKEMSVVIVTRGEFLENHAGTQSPDPVRAISGPRFARELLTSERIEEMMPLLLENHNETGSAFVDSITPDLQAYARIEQSGLARLFTARNGGELIGFILYILGASPVDGQRIANQHLLYVSPDHRGFGRRMIAFTEARLALDGVRVVYQSYNVREGVRSMAAFYERIGYVKSSEVFAKRLEVIHGL